MLERRRSARFAPVDEADQILIQANDSLVDGVISNVSAGGICVVVVRNANIPLGEELLVIHNDRPLPAVALNVTFDMATAAYGMEWSKQP